MSENAKIIAGIIQAQIGTGEQADIIQEHMKEYFTRWHTYKDRFTELEWYHIFLDFLEKVPQSPQLDAGEERGKEPGVSNMDILEMHLRGRALDPDLKFAILSAMNEFASRRVIEWAKGEEEDSLQESIDPAPIQQGEVPEEIRQWIESKLWEEFPYVYDDDAHALSVDAKRHAGKKIALALYYKLQQTLSDLTADRDQYQQWFERSQKSIASLTSQLEAVQAAIRELLKAQPQSKEGER